MKKNVKNDNMLGFWLDSFECFMSYLGVCFTFMNHHLHCEFWKHLCAYNSVEKKGEKADFKSCYLHKLSHWQADIVKMSAHLPLKRIQPANTRGQRWQACRMSAALSRRSGSTWGQEFKLLPFSLCKSTRTLLGMLAFKMSYNLLCLVPDLTCL